MSARRPPGATTRTTRDAPSAPVRLLTFDGASERDPRIEPWLAGAPPALEPLARRWFAALRRQGPDVRELLHDGGAIGCVEGAPFAGVFVYRAHANLALYRGAELPDPAGLLQGTGRWMRHVKLRPGAPLDEAAVEALLAAAHANIRAHLAAGAG